MRKILIAPSILACDFTHLAEEVKRVEDAGADCLHVDVMDGHFVPNISVGVPVVACLKKVATIPLDVHLMIANPEKYIIPFQEAGADYLTFHVEATNDTTGLLQEIKKRGMKGGVSLKPKTLVSVLHPFLVHTDMVLVMTVEPGFGGQSFMSECIPKIQALRACYQGIIAVDGGVDEKTAPLCLNAGANFLVAGTAIFKKKDVAQAIRQIRGEV